MPQVGKHMPIRQQGACEWPYVAGSTCLVMLLVWQPFQQPSLALEAAEYVGQRSLQAIDPNCYQVHSETLADQHCGEECAADKATATRPDAAFELSRSILTCQDSHGNPLRHGETDKPPELRIEVIKPSHAF